MVGRKQIYERNKRIHSMAGGGQKKMYKDVLTGTKPKGKKHQGVEEAVLTIE